MDIAELVFRIVGGLYVAAAWFGARAMMFRAVADSMIGSLSPERPVRPRHKHLVHGACVVFTAGGAVALALMGGLALPLFAASLVLQVAWLAWVALAYPPRNESEAQDRRRTAYAAVPFAAATLGVAWMWRAGRLGEAMEPSPALLSFVVMVWFSAWLLRGLRWDPRAGDVFDDPDLPREPSDRPKRIRLDPCFGLWPLVDIDRDCRFNHLTWLPEDLAFRIEDWDDTFQLAFDVNGPAPAPDFGTGDRLAAYLREGRHILLALHEQFGSENVEVSPVLATSP